MKNLAAQALAVLLVTATADAQTTYKYDALGRLIEVRETTDSSKIEKYTYDAADNRTAAKSGNAAPTAVSDSYFLMTTSSTWSGVLSVLGNDTDPDLPDDTLSVLSTSGSAYASAVSNGVSLSSAPLGTHSFSYTAKDAGGLTSSTSVWVQVVYCNPTCELGD